MKRLLQTLVSILVFMIFFNLSQINAAIWQSNSDNGGGEWSETSTWINMITGLPGVPGAGDLIIINGSDMVTISSTVNLKSPLNNKPTNIFINGTLKFWSSPGCQKILCNVDLLLDSGSVIDVQSTAPAKGIQEGGPNPSQKDIFIGGASVLPPNEWPFGPGILPMLFLPVQLVTFNGVTLGNSNMLKWQTGSEDNTKEFILERSTSGRDNFEEIGAVNAMGFSANIQNYSFEDKEPIMMGYYRLKVLDFDGSFEYSEIIALEKDRTGVTELEIFPVPIQNEVNILINSENKGNAVLSVLNYLGQVIIVEQLELTKGVNKFTFNWNDLNSGVHFVVIDNGNERLVKKVF